MPKRADEKFNISFSGLIRKVFDCQIQYFMGFIRAKLQSSTKIVSWSQYISVAVVTIRKYYLKLPHYGRI